MTAFFAALEDIPFDMYLSEVRYPLKTTKKLHKESQKQIGKIEKSGVCNRFFLCPSFLF